MFTALRGLLALCLLAASLSAFASPNWQQPTADELKMTSYAADPHAPAVYLSLDEDVDDGLNAMTFYARVKILSEKGKDMFADVEIPYNSFSQITYVAGRTIHSNGAVIPFTGKPYDKLLVKTGYTNFMAKVFSLPDVQVGSILEFQYRLSPWMGAPHWELQMDVPILKAHYHFYPVSNPAGLMYSYHLPKGAAVTREKNGSFDLTVENIPALPDEDYLPPLDNYSYRLFFYYSAFKTSDDYWSAAGKIWSKDLDHFTRVSDKIRDAVNGIVAPNDSDEQKVQKIYGALMKFDNTSFTREHTAQENKAEHVKIKSAEDIWAQRRGDGLELTWLFLAMVRAAGLKAYGATVVDRDQNLFDPTFMSWSQWDEGLVIVVINGKEVYFDPGQRYCEFGKLHWKHTWTGGIRQIDNGTELFTTPPPTLNDNDVTRSAQLILDENGQVRGTIREMMTGAPALLWRQAALTGDEAEAAQGFQEELQRSVPTGVQVGATHFVGLADFTHPLTVISDVSGTLGTQTGKHMLLPAVFFEARSQSLFTEAQRENTVDLHYPYETEDHFQLALPPNITVESLPNASTVPLAQSAEYQTQFASTANGFEYSRLLRVGHIVYKPADYPSLRNFFQTISSDDHAQVALRVTPEIAGTAGN